MRCDQDALNLNVHFHTLVLDGVYEGDRFRPLSPPDDRGGLRLGDRVDAEDVTDAAAEPPRCATIAGVSLHANVCVPARDRQRLERLCRYVARPPLAGERLSVLDDGRLLYRLKRRWRDGTTHMVFEPLELIEKLAALVPPPRLNLVRYHGVLAPAARNRAGIVPGSPGGDETPARNRCACGIRDDEEAAAPRRLRHRAESAIGATAGLGSSQTSAAGPDYAEPGPHPRHYTWQELMRRVFAVDVLECPRCKGRMRILAQIHPPDTTQAILECLDLPIRPPPVADPEPAPDPGFEIDPFVDIEAGELDLLA